MARTKRKAVYVAGAYSAKTVMGVCANARRGRALVQVVEEAGFAPYDPWADLERRIAYPADIETAYATALAWLERADAVLVVQDGADASAGTQREIARATELCIPVFWTLAELIRWGTHD